MQDRLGVRVTLEGVASRLKIGTKVDVVVNFAVDDEVQAAILVRHGLVPPLAQINDGETRMTESDPIRDVGTGPVRPPVVKRRAHMVHGGRDGGRGPTGGDDASAAAPLRRRPSIAWR